MTPAPHLAGRPARGSLAGRAALHLYHQPRAWWRRVRATGWREWIATARSARQMRTAARRLQPPDWAPLPGQQAPVVFLTGTHCWWETAFCAHSLAHHLRAIPELVFISDGTLRAAEAAVLRRLFPAAEVITPAAVEADLRVRLDPREYPLIWYYRAHKPILRKLTDVFGRADGWQLLLDSDMLFFREPRALADWLREPREFIGMRDVATAYGYSLPRLESLAGAPLPDRLNIGVFGLAGARIDWRLVEGAMRTLLEQEGLQYNLCQGLAAILYARHAHRILPAADYLVLPAATEVDQPTAVMHHYVAGSKPTYRLHAWRRYLSQVEASVASPAPPRA